MSCRPINQSVLSHCKCYAYLPSGKTRQALLMYFNIDWAMSQLLSPSTASLLTLGLYSWYSTSRRITPWADTPPTCLGLLLGDAVYATQRVVGQAMETGDLIRSATPTAPLAPKVHRKADRDGQGRWRLFGAACVDHGQLHPLPAPRTDPAPPASSPPGWAPGRRGRP